jgi:site-specific DNA-methyltransferase (adenine-specific)
VTAVVLRGDARRLPLPDGCADLICTSPPYFGLRSYTDDGAHYDGQIGSEATPQEWLAALAECTREWVRVLKPSGSLFVNLGDKYVGSPSGPRTSPMPHPNSPRMGVGNAASWGGERRIYRAETPPKSLLGLPWRYAIACTDQLGLILRRDIIWSKPNGLPESVTDRCRSSHEYLFHFTVRPRYYAAVDEIREPHLRPKTAAEMARDCSAPRGSTYHSGNAGIARGGVREDDPHTYTGSNPLGKLPGSVWPIPSQPLTVPAALGVDHFAAWPMEIPRRIILGWSPSGVCCACGEGRRPVVDVGESSWRRRRADGDPVRYGDTGTGSAAHLARSLSDPADRAAGGFGVPATRAITGYACACAVPDAPTRPALVVDPFGGTGTTALVAAAYGRVGVSVDLSGDYCRLARWRTQDPGERARALEVPKPPPVADGQASLFDMEAS